MPQSKIFLIMVQIKIILLSNFHICFCRSLVVCSKTCGGYLVGRSSYPQRLDRPCNTKSIRGTLPIVGIREIISYPVSAHNSMTRCIKIFITRLCSGRRGTGVNHLTRYQRVMLPATIYDHNEGPCRKLLKGRNPA